VPSEIREFQGKAADQTIVGMRKTVITPVFGNQFWYGRRLKHKITPEHSVAHHPDRQLRLWHLLHRLRKRRPKVDGD
jgi:hypothetical protein